jgi:transcriptional regulator with PAS, ATPase and Fis domain
VLITGESGTGKELAASAIHTQGLDAHGPFIAINCAAISHNLFESELFGHEKGAFSGADSRKDGVFFAADGGTLFLDEIGEIRHDLQAKLLRVLETGEVRRVGSTTTHKLKVRIIAATNRKLSQMVRDSSFREDLLYRLSILTLRLPPLRDRLEDLPVLSRTILERNESDAVLSEGALRCLGEHHWPGNVRELRNVLLRSLIMHGPMLKPEHFEFNQWWSEAPTIARKKLDRPTVEAALLRYDGNRSRTAKELGIPRSTLIYKIKHWEIPA